MKSAKVFLLLVLALYAGLIGMDYLKAVIYPLKHPSHSLIIWLKTFFLVSGGILIMWLTLEKRVFKTFLIIYCALWAIYYIIKWIAKLPATAQATESAFSANKMMLFYLNITQLLTPFPFFFFWVLNRVFKSLPVKKEP